MDREAEYECSRWPADGSVSFASDHRLSLLADPNKNLFYCYGCSRGADAIRLAQLYHHIRFVDGTTILRPGIFGSLLTDVIKLLAVAVTPSP